ncbi:WD40-repeat-containing domain protein [Dipodascopsis uninucleata]
MMADTDSGISEYERQRRANIERNNALLRELELASLGASISPTRSGPAPNKRSSSSRNSANKKKTKTASAVKIEENIVPRRTSARLAGIKPESDEARIRAEKEYEVIQEQSRVQRQRIAGDMRFEDISKDKIAKLWTFDTDADTLTEEERVIDGDIVKLRKELSNLKLYERFAPNDIKITPERIFCIGFHPSISKKLVLAGDKIGNLGIWDVDQVKEEDEEVIPRTYLFKVHARTLSSYAFPPSTHEKVYSSSYDGSIRCVDFATGVSSEVYYGEIYDGEPDAQSELHFSDPNTLYFATLSGEVCRVDLRSSKDSTKYRLHEKKIGGFSLHPGAHYLCASASLDRTMKIWDFRNLSTNGNGEVVPMNLGIYESRLSISCTSWNSVGDIVCNGYDDTINIFNLKDSAEWPTDFKQTELAPCSKIRHNCQTGRWVTILKAHWQERPIDLIQKFVIGNMNRFMDVYTADGIQLARLGDSEMVSAVPAACRFHPVKNWIVGGTASGKVVLYS